MERDDEIKNIIIGVILMAVSVVIIPILINKLTKKVYICRTKVTEKDFINNAPETVKKSEDRVNDD